MKMGTDVSQCVSIKLDNNNRFNWLSAGQHSTETASLGILFQQSIK